MINALYFRIESLWGAVLRSPALHFEPMLTAFDFVLQFLKSCESRISELELAPHEQDIIWLDVGVAAVGISNCLDVCVCRLTLYTLST